MEVEQAVNRAGLSEAQAANYDWWTRTPMTYDWSAESPFTPGTREWFEEVDRRFLAAAYFAEGEDGSPFGHWMRPEFVKGKDVLEVGCGMGTHASLLARGGARLTAVDLTERAIEMTSRRFEIFGLDGRIVQADAEKLPFPNASFDTVWSWGVLHASSSFDRALAECSRVLRPGGHLLIMVYHHRSLFYYAHGVIRGVLLREFFRGKSLDDIYDEQVDGAYARLFTPRELAGILGRDYENVTTEVVGDKVELLPIPPSAVKDRMKAAVPDRLATSVLKRFGFFVVAEGTRRTA